jgi:uncharacterized protein
VRFFVDTAVFLYAVGAEHPLREPCRELVRRFAAGSLNPEASVELVQEYVHVRTRRGMARAEAVAEGRDLALLCRLHAVEEAELHRALALFAATPGLGLRDAVHAVTALDRGVGLIVSPDRAFDAVPALKRVDPGAALARLGGETR